MRQGSGAFARTSLAIFVLLVLVAFSARLPQTPAHAATGTHSEVETLASPSPVAANVTGLLTIDPSLFEGSVPATAIVGNNYTLRVQITSNANVTLPAIVRVIAPVDDVFIHPVLFQVEIPPGSTIVENFSMVPVVIWHQTPLNLTAAVWVWFKEKMSSPELFDQSSSFVYGINANPFPFLPVLVLSGIVVTGALTLIFYPELTRKGHGRARQSADGT